MNSTELARLLLEALGAPRGALSVVAMPDPKHGFVLTVWARSDYPLRRLPSEFLGFPVKVESQPRFSAPLVGA